MIETTVPAKILDQIDELAELSTTPVSLRQLYEFARTPNERVILEAARFLHHEMPIRLARKVKELENFPRGLSKVRWIQVVKSWYTQSFKEMVEFPTVRSLEDDKKFCALIDHIKDRHRNQVAVMARGLREYMNKKRITRVDPEIQNFLDSFLLSRIGIRVLLGHHTSIHKNRPGWVGIICAQTPVAQVAEEAAGHASLLCARTLGDPPQVKMHGNLNLKFKYIPSHLQHMFFELFKNSFRATVEKYNREGGKLNTVHVVIAGGMEDVSIKISDAGGGIPRSGVDRIFEYAYTTANPVTDFQADSTDILAGLGYGLPLCRLYARYFGGEMRIISLEGFGTDAYLHLNRLGTGSEYIT